AVKVKDEIAHRLVSVRGPRGGRNRVGVKKPRVGDPVNRGLVNSTIVETVEIRNCPRTSARGWLGSRRGSRWLLINVGIPHRTNIDFWIELPVAHHHAFSVLTRRSDLLPTAERALLRKRRRGNAHERCHG